MRWNHLGPDVKLRAYKTAVQYNKYFELFENTDFESKTWKKTNLNLEVREKVSVHGLVFSE